MSARSNSNETREHLLAIVATYETVKERVESTGGVPSLSDLMPAIDDRISQELQEARRILQATDRAFLLPGLIRAMAVAIVQIRSNQT